MVRLNQRQETILATLENLSEDLADIYMGSLHARSDRENPDYVAQTAHAVRELSSSLPRYVGASIPERFEATDELDILIKEWDAGGAQSGGFMVSSEKDGFVKLSSDLYWKLEEFFDRYRASRMTHVEETGLLLEAFEPLASPFPQSESLQPIIHQWVELHRWFVGVSHHKPCDPEELNQKLVLFDDALFGLLAPFYSTVNELDALLEIERPSPEDVESALALLKKREHVTYFFTHLKHPGWLGPLKAQGYFAAPPDPVRRNGRVSFPMWPEAVFLRVIAKDEPDEVVSVISSLSKTENVIVQNELVEALLNMPSAVAIDAIGMVKEWVRDPSPLRFHHKLGALMSKFANEDQDKGALELADTLLEPMLVERDGLANLPGLRLPPQVKGLIDDWYYSEILRDYYPSLLLASPMAAFRLLGYKLRRAIRLEAEGRHRGRTDSSYIWRPAIEPHEQNARRDDVKNSLATALRDAGEWISREYGADAAPYLDFLIELNLPIFRRLEMHLLYLWPDLFETRIIDRLLDRDSFDSVDLRHEYVRLMGARFAHLPKTAQEEILGWIAEGPDVDQFRESARAMKGEEPSDEDVDRYVRRWQLGKLTPMADSLPEGWRLRYEELIERNEVPEDVDFPYYITSFLGPTSPIAKETIGETEPDKVVDFMRKWRPQEVDFGPSPEGFGRVFASVVQENPERYVAICDDVKEGIHPTYVRSMFQGLTEACKVQRPFEWESVLDLSEWALRQPRDEMYTPHLSEADENWIPTRRAVAALLSQALMVNDSTIPFNHRERVWSLITSLLEDPEPTPSYEAEYGGENVDPASMAINTVRGLAFEAVIRYALWAAHHLNAEAADELTGRNWILAEMPEVDEALNGGLKPELEPARSVRSLYGRYLPQLFALDLDWTQQHLPSVFPEEPGLEHLRLAAFEAFLLYSGPHPDLAQLLEPQYRWATGLLRDDTRAVRESVWAKQLAVHLMKLYLWGLLPLEDESMIPEFFAGTSSTLRAYATTWIGHGIRTAGRALEPEIRERLQTMWDAILDGRLEADPEVLVTLGLWASSPAFEPQYMLTNLGRTLELTDGMVDAGGSILGRLKSVADEHPIDVVRILRAMVQGDKSGMRIYGWREGARKLLERVLRTNDQEAVRIARDVINHLGAVGFHDFRDLLDSDNGEG